MTVLRSYAGGSWVTPAGEGRPVFDAVTGDEVARVSSAGVDLAAALDHGRSAGGPALRELTFHQRAAQLEAGGAMPRGHPGGLFALSAPPRATPPRAEVHGGRGIRRVPRHASPPPPRP